MILAFNILAQSFSSPYTSSSELSDRENSLTCQFVSRLPAVPDRNELITDFKDVARDVLLLA